MSKFKTTGTGRDISKWNGTLEKALVAHIDMLNACKTNADLIDTLMACETAGLNTEATEYTDKLIADISSNPNFEANFQRMYNVYLKGLGLGVLRCSTKTSAKRISESENPTEHFVDLMDELQSEDEYAFVKLPAESKYAGKYLYIAIAERGNSDWDAHAAILNEEPSEDIFGVMPENVESEGYTCLASFENDGPYGSPTILEISKNEYFISTQADYTEDGKGLFGIYFGKDVKRYLDSVRYYYEDDDWDDDESYDRD